MNTFAVALIAIAGFSLANPDAIATTIDFSSDRAEFRLERNRNPEISSPTIAFWLRPRKPGGSR